MPRQLSAVKSKPKSSPREFPVIIQSRGLIDLHFHGAFGIDVMCSEHSELNELSRLLGKEGIAGFCPTTLSAPADELKTALDRLGAWIHSHSMIQGKIHGKRSSKGSPAARPLGIHLEGPFISTRASGAHPPDSVRPFSMRELQEYWDASRGTLKIVTLAADEISSEELAQLVRWSRKNEVSLSLGHTHASEECARRVFNAGVTSVTHAWNALRFHHRDPGVLGAAVGRRDVFLELILDQIHVSPTLIRWTCELHGPEKVCFVSDCAPAAATDRMKNLRDKEVSFGPLSVRLGDGAARLPDGTLAGGGLLLSEAYAKWLSSEAARTGTPAPTLLRRSLPSVTSAPLRSLNLPLGFASDRKMQWRCTERSVRPLGFSTKTR